MVHNGTPWVSENVGLHWKWWVSWEPCWGNNRWEAMWRRRENAANYLSYRADSRAAVPSNLSLVQLTTVVLNRELPPATAHFWYPIFKRKKQFAFLFLILLKYHVSKCLYSTSPHNMQQRPYVSPQRGHDQKLVSRICHLAPRTLWFYAGGGFSQFACPCTPSDAPGHQTRIRGAAMGHGAFLRCEDFPVWEHLSSTTLHPFSKMHCQFFFLL